MQIILYVKEEMKKNNIPEPVVIGIVWSSVMSTVEWNKKEELVAEQAIKHLKVLELCLCKTLFCFLVGISELLLYLEDVSHLVVPGDNHQ